jgi:hypothetical protein
VAAFNFNLNEKYTATFNRQQLQWKNESYELQDFLTGKRIGRIEKGQKQFSVTVNTRDAVMIKVVGKG